MVCFGKQENKLVQVESFEEDEFGVCSSRKVIHHECDLASPDIWEGLKLIKPL